MNERLRHIIISPAVTIREAMEHIDTGVKQTPPSPWGIALVMDGEKMLGIVTDGDIRGAILSGASLEDPIKGLVTKDPLSITRASPSEMLSELHKKIKERGGYESKYHQILVLDERGAIDDFVTPFELWKQSDMKIKTVAVVGLGYVGLTLALTLNEFGINVVGIDTNEEVIGKLKKRIPHFFEKGLDKLLKKHANELLTLKTSFAENESDIYVISVGTPVDDDGNVVMSHLEAAVAEVGRVLKPHDLVILRSTVPMGTCRNVVIPILEEKSGLSAKSDFFVAFAPERTAEGKALEELKTLPQVIGGFNRQSLDMASKFFQIFTHTIVAVDNLEEAEAVKLLNNTFRDLSFSFSNEVAQICEGFDINARRVIRAANEGYIRNPIPYPSPGVGGACLVKDPHLFAQSAKSVGREAKLPLLGRNINESMTAFVCDKVDHFCKEQGKDSAKVKLFLMGMAFKGHPETSDIRHSTAVDILKELQKNYSDVTIYDPVARKDELETLGAKVIDQPKQGFEDVDVVLVLNNHPSFGDLDIFTLAGTMKEPGLLFDPWGMFTREQLSSLDTITYDGL